MQKLSTNNVEKEMSFLHLWVLTNRIEGNKWQVELIPLRKRYNVHMKLGKKCLEITNTVDFFKWIIGHYGLNFLVTHKIGRWNFKVHFWVFFWEMEKEKDISSGQIKYLIQKKKGSQEIMRWVYLQFTEKYWGK